jgi:hypothetical protein
MQLASGQGAMSTHHMEFSARLARIESGIGSSKSTLYVGMDETYAVTYGRRGHGHARGSSVTDTFRKIGYPIIVMLAFLIGVAANLAARLVDFIWNGLPSAADNIDMQMAMNFGTALILSSVLGLFFRIRIRDFVMVRLIGIGAGVLMLHNVVHAYPQYFTPVFSPEWVSHIVSSTEAGSIVWRGVSIVI